VKCDQSLQVTGFGVISKIVEKDGSQNKESLENFGLRIIFGGKSRAASSFGDARTHNIIFGEIALDLSKSALLRNWLSRNNSRATILYAYKYMASTIYNLRNVV